MMILVKAINEEVSFLKKKEAVFIGALLVISVVLCIFVYAVPHGTHGSIQITVDGELYGTYSLAEDQVIQIGDTNVCEIKDGEVKMTEADCPDHLCMKQPAVGSAGGYIVCLPNRVVIQGEGDSDSQDSESGFDAEKDSVSWAVCSHCHYFRVCGIVDSVFCGNSRNETRACKSGGAFCAGEVYVERSGAGFHCENFYYRFYVWKRLQYYV